MPPTEGMKIMPIGQTRARFCASCPAPLGRLNVERSSALAESAIMARTRARPLPTGQLTPHQAVIFAAVLALLSMTILVFGVNALTAVLTFLSLIGYSVIYTLFLKPATPQNIVIGGAAGAAPPVLGWTAVTGNVSSDALLLFLIIFVWTPPHFWSLALYREREYAKVGIPMLPVTHGSKFTRQYILFYTILLAAVTVMPFATRMSGLIYLIGAVALNAGFIAYAWTLYRNYSDALARKTFGYSIQYRATLFAQLLRPVRVRTGHRRAGIPCISPVRFPLPEPGDLVQHGENEICSHPLR